ncbi:hypothetical protein JCM10207_007864 [Rhodosporidiobolus poonsookiae]
MEGAGSGAAHEGTPATAGPVPPPTPPTPSLPHSDPLSTVDQPPADEQPQQEQHEPVQRISFYVQAADDMLDAVLDHEAFLFNPHELAALHHFRAMDYQARYLFMRLFLRKHGQWIRLAALRTAYSPSIAKTERTQSSFPLDAADETPEQTPDPATLADALDSPAASQAQAQDVRLTWKSDITDLDAACATLWEPVDLPPAEEQQPKEEDVEMKPAAGVEVAEQPVAGPSTPPKRLQTPPPRGKSEQEGVLDLTLTDSDDDGVLDLTHSPARPPRPPPRSAKARGKQPARPPAPSPPPARPALDTDDLSRLAWSMDDLAAMEDPEGLLGLLSLDELSALGKRMKVKLASGRSTRADWTQALLKTSNQSTLSFFIAPAAKSTGMKRSPSGSLGVSYDAKGKKNTQSAVVVKQTLSIIGPVIRLHPAYLTLFQRLSLVYHRTSYTAVSTSALTASLLARFGKRRYPSYTVSRSFRLFPSRAVLVAFEHAVETERRLEACLDGAWAAGLVTSKKRAAELKEGKDERWARYANGVRIWEDDGVEGLWDGMCDEAEREMGKLDDDEDKRVLYYRRRFHPGWPLSRAAYKAAGCYAKLGQHAREAALLRRLLAQTSFRRGKRGDWYDRLALVLMKYPGTQEGAGGGERTVKREVKGEVKAEQEGEGKPKAGGKKRKKSKAKKEEGSDEELDEAEEEDEGETPEEKRERLEEALRVCEAGLDDPFTHLIYKSSLLRRIARLHSSLSLGPPPADRSAALLLQPRQRTMEGERVDAPTVGRKSVWRLSDGAEGSVEELCLEQYGREGWKGFHSESGVLTMIFALTFWDILFAPVDGVFETPYQSAPLDLATDAFAIVRRPAITARLAALAAGAGPDLVRETDDRERPLGTWAVGTNWDRFSRDDLVEIVECMGGPALAAILTVFVEEYGHRTGGIPDLCLWNPVTRRVLFAEIKGPGDTLSETQKVWLDVLLGAAAASSGQDDEDEDEEEKKPQQGGVGVEVTRVVTSREGRSTSEEEDDGDGEDEDGEGKKRKRKKRGKTRAAKGRARSKSASVGGKGPKAEQIELLELDGEEG